MAKVKFLLQNKNPNIYVRYSISKYIILKRKTGFIIDFEFWDSNSKELVPLNSKLVEHKNLKTRLQKLANDLEIAYNKSVENGEIVTNDWLQLQIDVFNNKRSLIDLDLLTNYIQKYIDEAPTKPNQKRGTGLSAGRVKNIKLFKNTIKIYQDEMLKGKGILIKEINLQFVEKFKLWLFSKKYSINYIGKNIANLKTICNDASKNDIETSTQIRNFKVISESKTPEQIITLSEDEQLKIKEAIILDDHLINARKWLLLGCLIGQRGGDLLNITQNNIKENNGLKKIKIKQEKTGKDVTIPLLPDALEILESGIPRKISLTKFNEYIKKVCAIAKINEPTKGKVKVSGNTPLEIKTLPKYKFISSHVCRRSFATNFYGRIPTPILMNITAHGTEKMFLSYIGNSADDYADQFIEYFSKLIPKTKRPQLEVVHNTNTGTE
jgi:integrase